MKPKTIIMLILGGLLIIVLLQNTQTVSLRFLFWKFDISSVILLPLTMLIGFIIGIIIGRRKAR
ncbi:MAG: LapA family protein [Candidatus Omnitrophica bacterium]|nr:LapA family protein [Candidatus Omnitrophota bacterium]MDD5429284.1 LapA family protein [Candidatus Omnitrophota bacterium]